jgi:hypothetical protein
LEAEVVDIVDTVVTATAITRRFTPFQLRQYAERVLLAVDPDGCAQRAADANRHDSDVRYRTHGAGMATLTATGEALLLRAVHEAINMRATDIGRTQHATATTLSDSDGPGAPVSDTDLDADIDADPSVDPVGVRRVTALAALILGDQQAARPTVEILVTIDYRSLLGLTDTPATVAGGGPIPAPLARILATDATWRRLVHDPATGHLLDLGLSRYRPSAALTRWIQASDVTCRFPGCTRPARHTDIDHIHNHNPGAGSGGTDRSNLHPLCRRHHNLKTRKHWQVHRHHDGRESWTSPCGNTYRSEPYDYRPDDHVILPGTILRT